MAIATCPCDEHTSLLLRIPADLSCTGRARLKMCQIDKCIAPIVCALQRSGIDMRGSCCGHSKTDGTIYLADGRVLVIKPDGDAYAADAHSDAGSLTTE